MGDINAIGDVDIPHHSEKYVYPSGPRIAWAKHPSKRPAASAALSEKESK
jgi:hypothetical protein